MCFDADARPPIAPIAGAAVDAGDVQLVSADGTHFAAYRAHAGSVGGAGIVIVPDVRGLGRYYEELALRFAEAGAHAVAIDLYARTAGAEKRPDGFDVEPHVKQLRPDAASADVGAAVAYLRSTVGGGAERVYSVGFCIGGRLSFLQAAEGHGLSGVIGFYGWPVGEHRSNLPAPVERAARFGCPVLALYGGADERIPPDAIAAFDDALAQEGVQHESIVYEGAPHSFFDRRHEEFASASADAWRRTLDFIGLSGAEPSR